MADLIKEISALLLKEYIFQGLDVNQITEVASSFRRVRYGPNQTVTYEDLPGMYFYYVFKGKVKVSTIVRKLFHKDQEVKLYTYGRGNFFGEEALLFERPQQDIVRTLEETILLQLDVDNFQQLITKYPLVEERLTATAKSRRLARSKRFPWVADNEGFQYITRKHKFFLFRSLILPAVLFLTSLFLIPYTLGLPDPNTPTVLFQLLSILMLFVSVGWAVWNWVDWGNDFYFVTNQRIIWLEKIVTLYDSRSESPLYTLLTVKLESSQWGRWLGYGNVISRTYTGKIPMKNASNPHQLSGFIEGNRTRVLSESKEEEIQKIQEDIDKALQENIDPTAPVLEELIVIPLSPDPEDKETKGLREQIQTLLKVRYERDGVITYRKHWFVLIKTAWLPLLLMFILFMGSGIGIATAGLAGGFTLVAGIPICGIGTIAFMVISMWLLYDYVDWINDIYQLSPDQITEIYRKPLGTETKKTANIDNILSIDHERKNITGILLNFGRVIVYIGDTEFIFEGVYNPDQVHQDISDFQEALKQRKRKQQDDYDRKKMVNWLLAYHARTDNPEGNENPS